MSGDKLTVTQPAREAADRFNADMRCGLSGTQVHNLAGLLDSFARTNTTTELVEALREALDVLERIPYGDWPGKMYSGKTVAANALIHRARKALTLHDRALGR